MTKLRVARAEDEPELLAIDRATWATAVSPAPPPQADARLFRPGSSPADFVVAELDGQIVGYTAVRQALPLPAHEHVLEVNGLAVLPAYQRRGIARLLVHQVVALARGRGARKLALRVLGTNPGARSLYESCGFAVEGVLEGEFLLEGRYVDDVLMAVRLT